MRKTLNFIFCWWIAVVGFLLLSFLACVSGRLAGGCPGSGFQAGCALLFVCGCGNPLLAVGVPVLSCKAFAVAIIWQSIRGHTFCCGMYNDVCHSCLASDICVMPHELRMCVTAYRTLCPLRSYACCWLFSFGPVWRCE